MASDDTGIGSVRDEIAHCLLREMEERAAASMAAEVCARDAHSLLARCFADRARALSGELNDPSLLGDAWARRS